MPAFPNYKIRLYLCKVLSGCQLLVSTLYKDADWGFSTYRTSVSELREADRRMGQNAAGRREHGVSWDLADLEPEEDELGLPTTAGLLYPGVSVWMLSPIGSVPV